MLSSSVEAKRERKKEGQLQAQRTNEDNHEPQKNKSTKTLGDEKKKKRCKKPKELMDEEIAAKVAQENKSTENQGDEKKRRKKRRKKPKKLTDEEIAAKVAEGMRRRAKKKPKPKMVRLQFTSHA